MREPPCPRCGNDLGDGVTNGYCAHCNAITGGHGELDARASVYAHWYYDRSGNKITIGRWAWLTEHKGEGDYFRVASTEVDLYWVSTVWIGLDMGIAGLMGGAPLIFETGTFLAGEMIETERWPTEAAALAGHDRIVAEVREQLAEKAPNGE